MPWDAWLIFLFLGVVVPWRGRARMRKLLAMERVTTMERVALYATTIGFQWSIAAVVAWRAWVRGFTLHELGFVTGGWTRTLVVAAGGAALIGGFQWMNLRRMGKLPIEARGRVQAIAERLLPQTNLERLPFFALAMTAGICEEFLYRGYAMAAMQRAGLAGWEAVLVSSILFGLAHLYQGRGGLVGTLLLGTVFGAARNAYNSLIPLVLWHGTLDAVAGIASQRFLGPARTGQVMAFDKKPLATSIGLLL